MGISTILYVVVPRFLAMAVMTALYNAPPGIPSKITCPPSTASSSGGVAGPNLAADESGGMMPGMLGA